MIKATPASADIGLTLKSIALTYRFVVTGEVRDLAGVLNNYASYQVQRMEEAQVIPSIGDWGYYAAQVLNTPSMWFKAWVRWNLKAAVYDYYLEAEAGTVFDHATPYLGTLS